MKSLFFTLSFLMASSAFALVGTYTQKTTVVMNGMTEDECVEARGTYEDGECTMVLTNTLEVKKGSAIGLYDVSVSTVSARGNLCDLDFSVRQRGMYLIPTQRLADAAPDYSMGLLITKKGLRVIENLGEGQSSSPGCGHNATISGSGEEYVKDAAE